MFRDILFLTPDWSFRSQDGYIIFRWWRVYVPKVSMSCVCQMYVMWWRVFVHEVSMSCNGGYMYPGSVCRVCYVYAESWRLYVSKASMSGDSRCMYLKSVQINLTSHIESSYSSSSHGKLSSGCLRGPLSFRHPSLSSVLWIRAAHIQSV